MGVSPGGCCAWSRIHRVTVHAVDSIRFADTTWYTSLPRPPLRPRCCRPGHCRCPSCWPVAKIQHCTLTSPTCSCVRLFGVAPGRVMVLWAFLLAAMAPLVLLAGRRLPATVPDHNRHDNPTVETLIDMQKLGASLTRRESDCAWLRSLPLCTTEHPNNRTAWCKCALFAEVNNGSCALHGNLTDGECSRRGGVAVSAKPHPTFKGQATCECHRNATSLRNAETRPAGFSAEVVISHCVHPMEWLGGFLSELSRANATVVRITIIAKCGLSGASYAYGILDLGLIDFLTF